MKILFQLSGEHPELPRAELFAVLQAEDLKSKIIYENRESRILVLNLHTENVDFLERLAMTNKVAISVEISDNLNELATKLSERILRSKSIAVRSNSHTLEERLGEEFYNLDFKINLENPDVRILCFKEFKEDKEYMAGIEVPLKKNFDERKPQFRPFFHPTSMHPKLARVLVNLSRVKKGDILLDPFCGTGGILIEAGLIGIKVKGSDIDDKMVNGCEKNLKFFNLQGEIKKADALKLDEEFKGVDSIVTDLPYARSSFVTEKNLEDFYRKFLSSTFNILRYNGHLVLVIPQEYSLDTEKFDLIEEFRIRVHRSLTRKILVMKKPS